MERLLRCLPVCQLKHVGGGALQDFIMNLLDECAKVGITDISETIPDIAWHEGGNKTVEDTLTRAVETGTHTFGQKPALILILLPGNGKQSHCLQ